MLSCFIFFLYELPICLLWELQDVVRKHDCSTILESFVVVDTNTESFGSVEGGPSLVNSTGFFIFSAEDAFSTIDFSKAPIDDGVVDSPLWNNKKQSTVSSPLALKSSRWKDMGKAFPERYRRSQFNGPSHVASAMAMANAGENSPCFLEAASEDELQGASTDEVLQSMREVLGRRVGS